MVFKLRKRGYDASMVFVHLVTIEQRTSFGNRTEFGHGKGDLPEPRVWMLVPPPLPFFLGASFEDKTARMGIRRHGDRRTKLLHGKRVAFLRCLRWFTFPHDFQRNHQTKATHIISPWKESGVLQRLEAAPSSNSKIRTLHGFSPVPSKAAYGMRTALVAKPPRKRASSPPLTLNVIFPTDTKKENRLKISDPQPQRGSLSQPGATPRESGQ